MSKGCCYIIPYSWIHRDWQAPDDLDKQIAEMLKINEPAIVARSKKDDDHTSYDKDNALKALDVLTEELVEDYAGWTSIGFRIVNEITL